MRTIRLYIIFCLLGCVCLSATAQDDKNKQIRKLLRTGYRLFQRGDRDEATTSFQKALELDTANFKAVYNMATSMLPEEYWRPWPKLQSSKRDSLVHDIDSLFIKAVNCEPNPLKKSKSFYNLGVMYQTLYQSNGKNEQHLMQAIEAYKNALRNNPTDDEARYNLVVCQRQMKKKKNQPQPQQPQDQDKQQEQQNDSTKQNQQQQQQQNQQQQQEQQQLNQQRMDQLLQNAMQKEKETQRRMNEEEQQNGHHTRSNRKNW